MYSGFAELVRQCKKIGITTNVYPFSLTFDVSDFISVYAAAVAGDAWTIWTAMQYR